MLGAIASHLTNGDSRILERQLDPGSADANLAVAETMLAEGRLLEALELAMAAGRLDEDAGEAAGRVVRGVMGGWGGLRWRVC